MPNATGITVIQKNKERGVNMKCTCNEILLCDAHYNEYLVKHKKLLKECIAELLDKRCKENNLKVNDRIFAVKILSCEMAIRHSGTMALLLAIKFAEQEGCNQDEIKKTVLDRLSGLSEFEALLKDITE